jgi:hypothetical protein
MSARRAADRIDAGDARNAADLRLDDPVLHAAQIGRARDLAGQPLALRRDVDAGRGGRIGDRRHQDLAEPCGDRSHLRIDLAGENRAQFEQPFTHLLARE